MFNARCLVCLLLVSVSARMLAASWQDSVPLVYTDGLGRTMPYRLFLPPSRDPGQQYPLVLFLHGVGECGTDNQRQVQFNISSLINATQGERFTSYLVAPQVPVGDNWLSERSITLVTGVLAEVESNYLVDAGRLYVTGLSLGGFGAIGQLFYFPDKYAAGVPIASGVNPADAPAVAAVIKDIPIWLFHGGADTVVSVEWSRALYQALLNAGGTPRYTEYPGVGHDSWSAAYADAGDTLYPWLFAQQLYKPIARCSLSVASGEAPLEVCVDAEESTAAGDAELVGFSWAFGDGASTEGRTACHTYVDAGVYRITLRVTDNLGRSGEADAMVFVHCTRYDVAPWSSADVGDPSMHGAARLEEGGGSIAICAGGRRLTGTTDTFHFVHRQVRGDMVCAGRASAFEGAGGKGQIGVMVRESLEPNARFVAATFRKLLPASGSLLLMHRSAQGGSVGGSSGTINGVAIPNAWVKIVRHGDEFIGSASVDGEEWQELNRLTISGFAETAYAGFASMSADPPVEGATFEPLRAEVTDALLLECPGEGDTRCTGLVVQGPEGGGPGAYTATASAEDDSGDLITYVFTAEDLLGTVLSTGAQIESSAVFDLTEGTWIISVRVDDDPYCDDAAAANQCRTAVEVAPAGGSQLPGDVNQDGMVDIADAICLLGYLFDHEPPRLPCGDGSELDAANIALASWNGDAAIDIADPICVLTWLFGRGPEHALGEACRRIPGCPSVCGRAR